MREGLFEVIIIGEDGNQLEEVVIENKSYVIAIPGKEYSVKVQVYKNLLNNFPAENMRVGLYVISYYFIVYLLLLLFSLFTS